MCLLLSIIHNFDQHRLIYLGFSVIIRPFICTQTIKHILFYNKSWTVFFISVSRYNHEILCSMSSTHFRYFPVGKLFTFFLLLIKETSLLLQMSSNWCRLQKASNEIL